VLAGGGRVAAALVAGAALGLGARIAMRIIALASGRRGSFSWSGSFEVALFGALMGVPVALGFFLARDRWPSRVAWPGMLLGGVLWGLFAVLPPASARSAWRPRRIRRW